MAIRLHAKRRIKRLSPLAGLIMALVVVGSVFAADVSKALYTIEIRVSNSSTGTTLTNAAVPLTQGISNLIDAGFVEGDALNTAVRYGTQDIVAMPSSDTMDVHGAVADDGGAQTDETTEATGATANDMTLLPATPATGDAYIFLLDTPGRILTLNIGTAGAGTWTITWEYWDGDSWESLSNVTDNTTGFTVSGTNTITYDMPADMAATTTASIYGYAVRGQVSSYTSITTQPLGTQAWYETGQWWTYVDSLEPTESRTYTLYLGGSTDMATSHVMFIGTQGITTTDAAELEISAYNPFKFIIGAFIDTSETSTNRYIAWKEDTFEIEVSDVAEVSFKVHTATVDRTGTITDVPSGFYSIVFELSGAFYDLTLTDEDGNEYSDTSEVAASAIPDNANPWLWGVNGSVLYFNRIQFWGHDATTDYSLQPGAEGKDTHANAEYPTTPDGDNASLYITANAGENMRVYIEFDLSTIPTDQTVSSASLLFEAYSVTNSGTLEVKRVTESWAESTLTWNNKPADSGVITDSIYNDATGTLTWDITALVQDWLDSTYPNYGMMVRTQTSATNYHISRSSDYGVAADRPELEIVLENDFLGYTSANKYLDYYLTSTPTMTLTDYSGNGNSGAYSFPAQPSALSDTLTVTPASMISTRSPENLRRTASSPDVAAEVSAPPNITGGESGNASIPFYSVFTSVFGQLASDTGDTQIPTGFFFILLFTAIICGVGIGVYALAGAEMAAIIMGALILGATQIGDGIYPLWMLFIYIPIAVLTVMTKRRLEA